MANQKVDKNVLDSYNTPDDMRFDMSEYVDVRVASDEDAELIKYLANETTAYSGTQIEAFVINGEVTDHRKIRQIAIEIRQRMVSLGDNKFQVKKAENRIKKLKRLIEKEEDELEIELYEEEIQKAHFDIAYTKQTMLQNEVEIKRFLEVLKKINPNGQESTMHMLEHYKDDWEKKEEEYWSQRMAKQAMMDMMTMGKISSGNLESIMGMPLPLQNKTIAQAITNAAQMEKGIMGIQNKVRGLLAEQEKNNPDGDLPHLLGIDGDYGGEKTKTQLKIGVDENNGIKAIENKQGS
jgi:hypothetical protein